MIYKWNDINHYDYVYDVIDRSTGQNLNDGCYISIDTETGAFVQVVLDPDQGFRFDPETREPAVITGVNPNLDVVATPRNGRGVLVVEDATVD